MTILLTAACGVSGQAETVSIPAPREEAPEEAVVSRAEQVMRGLAAAYPESIGPAEFRNGDWAVPVRGNYFYYAEGRILPESLRDRAGEYDPLGFYNYVPGELPDWKAPGPEDAARLSGMTNRRRTNPPKQSPFFFDALLRAGSREDAWDRIKAIRFLGRAVQVHYSILEELALVEERINAEARTSPAVRRWIDSINTLDGWNWRNVAESESRSFHAYGTAIDILPKSLGGLETYWLWAARSSPEWWTVPYNRRFHPPDAVIRAFEAYGFIWGGKWTFFDTMHFEYRPEIYIINGLPLTGSH